MDGRRGFNTQISVSSKDGTKSGFMSWNDDAPGWFGPFGGGPDKVSKLLEMVKEEFGNETHFNAVKKCVDHLFTNERALGF